MLENHINPHQVGNLNRLALVGTSGMGALTYQPDYAMEDAGSFASLDKIAEECGKILGEKDCQKLDALVALGGSSGGAHPKILTQVDGEAWLIKFPASGDGAMAGVQEYEYALCARECGISMAEPRLFASKRCGGYFGTKRFDRCLEADGTIRRIHMLSVSAVLETSHRIPNLDYDILMRLTLELTKDFAELKKLYRLMCFNVFAHNRDDHSRNFSFLYDEEERRWVLSPAYDLTYSNSLGGEHATTVHGNGQNPQMKDVLAVAETIGLQAGEARRIAQDVRECVQERLGKYL